MQLIRYGTVTLGGQELRVGTSRFLSQGAFLAYKSFWALFFMSWAIYWREGLNRPLVLTTLTHQTWYIAMVYFFASAASAFLCWRAINKGAITGGGSVLQNGVVEEGSPGLRTTEVNEGSGQPVPLALRMLQLVTWNIACLVSLVVVSLFWVADYTGWAVTSVDVLAHGAIAPIMMVDQFLVADEFKLRHVVIAQAYGVFYVLFNVIWYYEGWKNKLLYEVLDWDNKPLVACIYSIGSVVILIPLFALVHSFIYRRREQLHRHLDEKLSAARRSRDFSVIGQASTSI